MNFRMTLLILFWLFLSGIPAQEDPEFKSFKAREAKKTFLKAQKEYELKLVKAQVAYVKSLETAKLAAMKKGDLDEANLIDTEIKTNNEEIEARKETPGGPLKLIIDKKKPDGARDR